MRLSRHPQRRNYHRCTLHGSGQAKLTFERCMQIKTPRSRHSTTGGRRRGWRLSVIFDGALHIHDGHNNENLWSGNLDFCQVVFIKSLKARWKLMTWRFNSTGLFGHFLSLGESTNTQGQGITRNRCSWKSLAFHLTRSYLRDVQ